MGTTLTGMWRPEPEGGLIVFQVGDSRLYRYRRRELLSMTRDQTVWQQALDAGLRGKPSDSHLLLQAIGPSPQVEPEVRLHRVEPGDVYLLCTDGLHNGVGDEDIAAALALAAHAHPLECACRTLIDMARAVGGKDNITVVVVRFDV